LGFIYGFQLSFQEWTQQMKDMLDARKRGDQSFREKDFKTAIDCYSQVLISGYFFLHFRSVLVSDFWLWLKPDLPKKNLFIWI